MQEAEAGGRSVRPARVIYQDSWLKIQVPMKTRGHGNESNCEKPKYKLNLLLKQKVFVYEKDKYKLNLLLKGKIFISKLHHEKI